MKTLAMLPAGLILLVSGQAVATLTVMPLPAAPACKSCVSKGLAAQGSVNLLASGESLRTASRRGVISGLFAASQKEKGASGSERGDEVLTRWQIGRVFDALAQSNPGLFATHRCYSDQLTVAQLEFIMANYNALPPGLFTGGNLVPQFNMTGTVWTGNGSQITSDGNDATRAILTFSFPADATPWGNPAEPNALSANLTSIFGALNLDQGRELIRQSLANWRRNAGLTYSEVADSGIAMDFVTARRSTVGDIRIGAIPQGTTGVLAYNFFPNSGGDMAINSDYFTAGSYGNSSNTYRFFRNVIAHEHGHGIGLGHQTPCTSTKLMEPFANSAFEMVAVDDRRGAQRAYGDRRAGNTSTATAFNFGDLTSPSVRSVIERDLGLNGQWTPTNATGNDYFRFTLSESQTVTITAGPTGGSYVALNQTGGCNPTTGATENALNAGNISLELRAADGITVLLSANVNANGASEIITAGTLEPGNYFVRVLDAGPNDAANGIVQTYDLTVRVAASVARPLAIAGVNKRVAANTRCYFYGNINSLANEGSLTGFAWDFNNDGTFETNGSALSRTYVTNGTFFANLRVTNSGGQTATDSITVAVTGAVSAVTAAVPGIGNQGQTLPITITGTNFRGITLGGISAVGAAGITFIGTPVVDYFGTTITGVSMVISPAAAAGSRDLRVVTTDGAAVRAGGLTVNACPTFSDGPANLTVEQGQLASFSTIINGSGPLSYQWQLNGTPISSLTGVAPGSTVPLNIANVQPSDAGDYTVLVSGPCGSTSSSAATLTVTPPAATSCSLADIVGGDGNPPADGTVDGNDFTAFLNAFAADDLLADLVGGDGNPPADTTVDGNDFTAFLNAFAAGC